MYIQEDIPSKRLSCKTNYDIETPLIVEVNLKKEAGFWVDPPIIAKTKFRTSLMFEPYFRWIQ